MLLLRGCVEDVGCFLEGEPPTGDELGGGEDVVRRVGELGGGGGMVGGDDPLAGFVHDRRLVVGGGVDILGAEVHHPPRVDGGVVEVVHGATRGIPSELHCHGARKSEGVVVPYLPTAS